MKKVKIEIEVEVPDGYEWVAVDESGKIFAYDTQPIRDVNSGMYYPNNVYRYAELLIRNWRDTLTKVQNEQGS